MLLLRLAVVAAVLGLVHGLLQPWATRAASQVGIASIGSQAKSGPRILSRRPGSPMMALDGGKRQRRGHEMFRDRSLKSSALHFKVSENDEGDELDMDEEIIFDEPSFGGTATLKKISKAAVPLAVSLGFAASPGTAIGIRVAGAAAGGVAGMVVKKVIDNRILLTDEEETVSGGGGGGHGSGGMGPSSLQVAKALSEVQGLEDPSTLTLAQLEAIAKKHGVTERDLGEFVTFSFAAVVTASVSHVGGDLTNLIDVISFAEACELTQSEVGDGFALAAARMGDALERDERGYFVEKFDANVLLGASKVFFLADKMLGTTEGYYGKRLKVALSFFECDTFKEQITEAATTLWTKCVNAVIKNADQFSSEEVSDLRGFISVNAEVSELRPAQMANIVMEVLTKEMDSTLLGADGKSIDSFAAALPQYDNLNKAKSVLGWSGLEFDSTLSTKTIPLFESAVNALVQDLCDEPTTENTEKCAQRITERIEELHIDTKKARSILTTAISHKNAEYMNRIDKVYNASDGATLPAFKTMASYASVHEALATMAEPFMGGIDIPMPGLPFAAMIRVAMYEMKLGNEGKGISTGSIKDEMFDLNEEQQKIVKKSMALPKVVGWITQCIAEKNFAEGAKDAYQKLLDEYEVGKDAWDATAIDYYYQQAQSVAGRRQIPTGEDMAELQQLAAFLQAPEENVHKVHMEVLGDKYVKALTEAMTPSGVITEEYIEGLERLRDRLMLTEADAKSLVGFASRMRMGPVLKDLVDIWKSDTDANYRREKEKAKREDSSFNDKSRDNINDESNIFGYMEMGAQKEGSGPVVFMREALNLVDNFRENYAAAAEASIDASATGGDSVLPVTAGGISGEEDLVGIFKHYVITRVAEQDPALKARYLADEPIFAALLGLPEASQTKVKESLGYNAYKNMLTNMLNYREIISAQDQMQFKLLTDQIGLSEEAAQKVETSASQHALRDHAATLIRLPPQGAGASKKGGSMTAESARKFRNQVTSLGLDVQKDTGCNAQVVTYMYALEIQEMIESGDTDNLLDAQEGYGIPEERASEMVEATCRRYIGQILNFALRAARKYNEQECVLQTQKVLDYAQFIDLGEGAVDADGNMFSEDDKERLITFYEGSKRSLAGVAAAAAGQEGLAEVVGDSDKEVAQTLRSLINLTEDYKPAEGGIDGLLGLIQDFQGVGEEGTSKFANTGW